jgi:phosphoribosylanthranilate isomerase
VVNVKICGVTRIADAEAAVRAGATAIGLNFVPGSPRRLTVSAARAISEAIAMASGGTVLVVGVVADLSVEAMRALVEGAKLGCLQLHGDEPPEVVEAMLPHAYKALRIGSAGDVANAALYPGEYMLVDARSDGALGGTGETFDWSLVGTLARTRKLTLAGGLRPDNVTEAVRAVRPFCVDVASGVEPQGQPGIKDPRLIEAFVRAATSA